MIAATISITMISRQTALAAAGGYWRMAISFDMAATTDELWPPLMTLTTKKSPITSAMTKMEPSAIPVFERGITMSVMTRNRLAPPSTAASITARSIRAIELKIGTIMKSENRCTYAITTEKLEKRRNSSGWSVTPSAIKDWLKSPWRPRKGIHEIMRMTLDVQNGTVQSRNRAICQRTLRTWKTRKYETVKPITSVMAHTISAYVIVLAYRAYVRGDPNSSL